MQKIAAAKFFRRQADRGGHLVHLPFQREDALRRAESSKRAVRRIGGGKRAAADADVRARIRTGGVNHAARQHDGGERRVGTSVDVEIDFHGHQFAVARDAGTMPRARGMTLGGRRHIFGAIVNQLHRFARFPRQQRRVAGDHRRIFFLSAEASAGFHLNDANFLRRQAEQRDQRLVHVVRALHRTPHGDAVLQIGYRDRAVIFDVELFLRAGFVLSFDDDVGFGEAPVDVALVHEVRLENIVVAPDNLFFCNRLFERIDARKRLDIDAHQAARFFHQIAVGMRDQDDSFFAMRGDFVGEKRLVVKNQHNVVLPRHVFRSNNGEFIPRDAGLESDAANFSATRRVAHGGAVDHAGKLQVVDVLRLVGDFARALLAGHRFSDQRIGVLTYLAPS